MQQQLALLDRQVDVVEDGPRGGGLSCERRQDRAGGVLLLTFPVGAGGFQIER